MTDLNLSINRWLTRKHTVPKQTLISCDFFYIQFGNSE